MTSPTDVNATLARKAMLQTAHQRDTLLTTKLSVPQSRSTEVPRDQLFARLDDGLQRGRRLTLVSAPAGFGKTTLLSTWLRHRADMPYGVMDAVAARAPVGVAWLTLDPEDNQLLRFWTYLIAALQTIDSELGREALQLLMLPRRPPIRAMVSLLLNDLAAYSRKIILVLDDYEVVSAMAIHNSLAFLVEKAPPELHIVLSTRADPPLPFARLRARDQLTELRAPELSFTLDETTAFLTTMTGMLLSPDELLPLHASTEGWVVGLEIAGLELQRLTADSSTLQSRSEIVQFIHSFSGHQHDIRDFLEEEVLKHQSEYIRAFLLLTCTLERLNASLCDAVTAQTGSQAVLEQIEKANLFLVPLDGVQYWYRYHAMFADALQFRLHQARPDLVPVLHRRAAEWYAQHGYADQAIAHRIWADQIEQAIQSGDQRWMHLPHRALIELPSAGREVQGAQALSVGADDLVSVSAVPREDERVQTPAMPSQRDQQLGEADTKLMPVLSHEDTFEQLAEALTERELAILRLMAQGLTYDEMSRQLVISVNTVRFHVKNMYGKLNVHHRMQALARAKEWDLPLK